MENQRSHFNTLSSGFILSFRVNKSSMRHAPSSPINLRIKTFDKRHQIRSLSIAVIPLDIRIGLNTVCLALPVRVYKTDGHKVAIRNRVRIRHSQWIFQNRLDRTPDVDDLVSALEKLGCFVWQMVGDSVLGGSVGLIDVHALYGSAQADTDGSVGWGSADCVVEDEDAGGTGAAQVNVSFIRRYGFRGCVRVFE